MTDAGGGAPDLSPCAELVRLGDPDRFLSALLAPPALRERLFALYAFNLELARIPSVVSEPMLGMIRLEWWRESVAMIFDGGRIRAHEVVGPLAEAIRAAGLPRAPFERILAARARDAAREPPQDRAALDAHLADTGGALLELAALALAPGQGGGAAVADAGFAFAAASWLAAAPALAARGAVPFPGPDARAQAQALACDGLAALSRARAARGAAPAAARPAFAAGWRAASLLRGALAPEFDPASGPAAESEFRRRAGLLWVAFTGRW
jgi:phytoene/squalene synthetase